MKNLVWIFCVMVSALSHAATHMVNMTGNRFSPPNLTVNVGDTVTWVNQDFTGHDTVSGTNGVQSGVWRSPLFGRGGSFSFTFNVAPRYYGYYCTPHWPIGMVGSITVVAPNAPPSVSIINPVESAVFTAGDNVLIQATATDTDGSVTNVTFSANGSVIGSSATPPYAVTLNNIAVGNYALRASASDNLGAVGNSAVVNITVVPANIPPSVSITNPVNNQAFPLGTNVLIQADAADPDGSVTRVEFFTNGVSAGLTTAQPFALLITNLAVGDYILTAVATDNSGATGSASPVNISVFIPTEAPTILTPPQSQTGVVGSTITFQVSAIGTEPLHYQWRFNGTDVSGATLESLVLPHIQRSDAGTYSVEVTNVAGSVTSSPAVLVVTLPPNVPPVVSLVSPADGARFGLGANVRLVANATDSDGTITQVEFLTRTNLAQTNSLGVVTQPPYARKLSQLAEGTYFVLAKATDDRGGVAISPEVSFTVVSPPGITLSRAPTNVAIALGSNVTFTLTSDSALVTNLTLFADNVAIARGRVSPFVFDWRAEQPGGHSFFGVATDELGQSSTSAPLTLRVFIPESTRPTLSITSSPPNFRKFTSPTVALAGFANDNIGLDHVEFQINDGSINIARGTTAWAFTTRLVPGPNTLRVRSVDLAGIPSLDQTRFYTYLVNETLRVRINGNGTIQPDLNGRSLEVGKIYSLTATPGSGQLFAGWGGVTNTNNAALNFVMQPALDLVANFVANPFGPVAGTYNGLFMDTNHASAQSSGSFTMKVNKSGAFNGKLNSNASHYNFQGVFDLSGKAKVPIVRQALAPIVMELILDLNNGSDEVRGKVTTLVGTNLVTAQLEGARNVNDARTKPAPQMGTRAFVLRHGLEGIANGDATIRASGSVLERGMLNQTRFTLSTALSKEGSSPFYLSVKRGTEAIIGWLEFGTDPSAAVGGTLLWLREGTNVPVVIEAVPE